MLSYKIRGYVSPSPLDKMQRIERTLDYAGSTANAAIGTEKADLVSTSVKSITIPGTNRLAEPGSMTLFKNNNDPESPFLTQYTDQQRRAS